MPDAPVLSSDTATATAGFYRLSWTTEGGAVELQQAGDPAFSDATLLYRGSDNASLVSGRPDGDWYYRARFIDEGGAGPWSDSVKVEVAHHSLARGLTFFALGGLVFLGIVLFLVFHRERKHG